MLRGRPRKYIEEEVIAAACEVFWLKGYDNTSLDDLSEAMGMNRPSIYRAFGDKENIYRKALAGFFNAFKQLVERVEASEIGIKNQLTSLYQHAIVFYTSGSVSKGCMIMTTAVCVAPQKPLIKQDLSQFVSDIDVMLRKMFEHAVASKEISETSISIKGRTSMAQALLQSLAIRARSGESKESLFELIDDGIALMVTS